jgi:hypothetical protein
MEAVENETWIINQVRLQPDMQSRLTAPPVGAEVEVFVVATGDGQLIVRSAVIRGTPELLPTAMLTPPATSSPTPTAQPSRARTGVLPAAPVLDLTPHNIPAQGRVQPPDGTPAFQRAPGPMPTRWVEIRTPGPDAPEPAQNPRLTRVPGNVRTVAPTRWPQTTLLPDGSLTPPSFHTRLPLPTHGPRVTPQPDRTPLPGPTSHPLPTRQHVPARDELPGPGPTHGAPPSAEPTEQATSPSQRHGSADPTRHP